MGLEVIIDKNNIINDYLENPEASINISDLIIPFSVMFRKPIPPDIHSYDERIPFNERNPEFQKILYSEFLME